jgi:hypothetical protein
MQRLEREITDSIKELVEEGGPMYEDLSEAEVTDTVSENAGFLLVYRDGSRFTVTVQCVTEAAVDY